MEEATCVWSSGIIIIIITITITFIIITIIIKVLIALSVHINLADKNHPHQASTHEQHWTIPCNHQLFTICVEDRRGRWCACGLADNIHLKMQKERGLFSRFAQGYSRGSINIGRCRKWESSCIFIIYQNRCKSGKLKHHMSWAEIWMSQKWVLEEGMTAFVISVREVTLRKHI